MMKLCHLKLMWNTFEYRLNIFKMQFVFEYKKIIIIIKFDGDKNIIACSFYVITNVKKTSSFFSLFDGNVQYTNLEWRKYNICWVFTIRGGVLVVGIPPTLQFVSKGWEFKYWHATLIVWMISSHSWIRFKWVGSSELTCKFSFFNCFSLSLSIHTHTRHFSILFIGKDRKEREKLHDWAK